MWFGLFLLFTLFSFALLVVCLPPLFRSSVVPFVLSLSLFFLLPISLHLVYNLAVLLDFSFFRERERERERERKREEKRGKERERKIREERAERRDHFHRDDALLKKKNTPARSHSFSFLNNDIIIIIIIIIIVSPSYAALIT